MGAQRPRIIYVVPHRMGRSPSQRYRLEQFIPWFEEQGFEVHYRPLLNATDDPIFYARGNYGGKFMIVLRAFLRRCRDLLQIRPTDIVVLHREAFMLRGTFFEWMLRRRTRHLVFDFDDAIWLLDVSEHNRSLSWLKGPAKTGRIIAMCDRVIAGNDYLAAYARRHNTRVSVIPTVIDTARYVPVVHRPKEQVTIGWTGSTTSVAFLQGAAPMLRALHERFGSRLRFVFISDREVRIPGVPAENVRWNSADEVAQLAQFDIGIMPMHDDPWSRGKCGFKGLQYMGAGIPPVMSPVGVNCSIVQDGVNGFLANTTEEWVDKIGRLVDDAALRAQLGAAARFTVEEKWSVKAWREGYVRLFNELLRREA
jgi:glycosyltransferase involved in cell wall biosynthesis